MSCETLALGTAQRLTFDASRDTSHALAHGCMLLSFALHLMWHVFNHTGGVQQPQQQPHYRRLRSMQLQAMGHRCPFRMAYTAAGMLLGDCMSSMCSSDLAHPCVGARLHALARAALPTLGACHACVKMALQLVAVSNKAPHLMMMRPTLSRLGDDAVYGQGPYESMHPVPPSTMAMHAHAQVPQHGTALLLSCVCL